ncbi:BT_3987 domain-containing protein [Arcticibacter tournemirensis]|uniref:DUF1735 domain-containing protein n=2 Tax=Pseudomonadati TaxID=3379134 RepID=A0A4Q0M9E6_9SPHI|nr:DUF1735 domain-containing protein [Arcticibacter tournemirensis]RXF69705.1 DUF1735 domain-containing protein [Arcticibacter tournemirensis]
MNQLLVYRCILIITFIAGSCLLYSCKDSEHYDITGDTENRVYLPVGSYTVNAYNKYVFSVTHTPAGSIGQNIGAATPVMCTHPASADLKVSFSVNKSLVDTYNAEKGTNYSQLPDGMVDFNTMELTIPQGQLSSADFLEFSIPAAKYSQLTDSAYLMPLEINSVAGTGKATVSSNRNVVYLMIRTSQTNVYSNTVAGDMVGTLISPRSGWSATLNADLGYGSLSNMFDGRTNTYWYVTPAKRVALTVNLNNTYPTIRGIRIHSYSTTYGLTSIRVSTSTDGNSWTSQGSASLSTVAAYQYIKFYSSVSARYIKLEVEGWKSASYVIMSEFDVYTSN